MIKFLLEGEVYLITMEVNNTAALVNIFDCILQIKRCWINLDGDTLLGSYQWKYVTGSGKIDHLGANIEIHFIA